MKNKNVCKGCKYCVTKSEYHAFNGACDYCSETGRSRIMVEMANGGIKKDSCVCYEKGQRKKRSINAFGKKVGGQGEG